MHVAERISAEDHQLGWLIEFAPRGINIGHALRARLCSVEIDLHNARVGPHLDVALARSQRDNRKMRTRLGVRLTAEALAIAAIMAGAEGNAIGIEVRLRHVGGRSGKGVIAKTFRRLLEQRSRMSLDHRRAGIVALARSLEHIAAVDLLS